MNCAFADTSPLSLSFSAICFRNYHEPKIHNAKNGQVSSLFSTLSVKKITKTHSIETRGRLASKPKKQSVYSWTTKLPIVVSEQGWVWISGVFVHTHSFGAAAYHCRQFCHFSPSLLSNTHHHLSSSQAVNWRSKHAWASSNFNNTNVIFIYRKEFLVLLLIFAICFDFILW